MKIHAFSKYLEQLENTSKRLEITTILANLIKELDKDEVYKGIHLSLGKLKADYENPKFNLADKMMIRVIESAYSKTNIADLYGKKGDLGDVAYEVGDKDKTGTLTLSEVYEKLMDIALTDGAGSQELKVSKTAALLNKMDAVSAKFVVRIILGTTRLGFTELTVIAALAEILGDKTLADKIEDKYSTHPDLGLIAEKVMNKGIKALDSLTIETGIPILSQRCQRLADVEEIIEKMGRVRAEFKFDGTRVQAHLDKTKKPVASSYEQTSFFETTKASSFVKTFTRNQEETTHQFPDIIQALEEYIDADSVILDGEAIGYDRATGELLPLQKTMERKRKHNIDAAAQSIPLKYFVFDILFYNGKPLTDTPLVERRKILEKIVKKGGLIEPASYIETDSVDELSEFFEQAKEKNLEGIIVKQPDAVYQAGARSFSWVKLKKADEKLKQLKDTIDAVVLGYYFGKGGRTQFGVGGFLVGVYDEEAQLFKTFTKVGTGLTDDQFREFKTRVESLETDTMPKNYVVNGRFKADVWVRPKLVVEIGGDEISKSKDHSAEYALRFPRLIKFVDDKKAAEATTVKEILDLYNLQKRGYY